MGRWLLAAKVTACRPTLLMPALLVAMVAGSALVFAYPLGAFFQMSAAVLLRFGYGLVYPLIQAQASMTSPSLPIRMLR